MSLHDELTGAARELRTPTNGWTPKSDIRRAELMERAAEVIGFLHAQREVLRKAHDCATQALMLTMEDPNAGDALDDPAYSFGANPYEDAAAPAPSSPVGAAWKALQIGATGSAYDPPNTYRAFTYEHQPGNVLASRLGSATVTAAAASAGDSIDRGLGLLKALQEVGFGVFQIARATGDAEVSATTQALIDMLRQRDAAGRAKYGTTLDRTDLTHGDWLQHMAEELLDAAGYALAAKRQAGSRTEHAQAASQGGANNGR